MAKYRICYSFSQAVSPVLPHIGHSPISFLRCGLLEAQVPLNSLPVKICLMLSRPNASTKTIKMMSRV